MSEVKLHRFKELLEEENKFAVRCDTEEKAKKVLSAFYGARMDGTE